MIIWHYYRKSDGAFTGQTFSASDGSLPTPPPELALMAGVSDPESQRVDTATGFVVDYQPLAPSADHFWDGDRRRWIMSTEVEARRLRERQILDELTALDASSIRIREDLAIDPRDAQALQRFNDLLAKKDRLRDELRSLRSAT